MLLTQISYPSFLFVTVQSVPRETQIDRAVLVWVAAAGTLNVAMANTNPATMVTCCVLSIVISLVKTYNLLQVGEGSVI